MDKPETPKLLRRKQFGNPILRKPAKVLTDKDIKAKKTQNLISNMRHTLSRRNFGAGLAATQVGRSIALAVIKIEQTPERPNRNDFEAVIINPKIVKTYGRKTPMWEGCISFGSLSDPVFAQVPRYEKIKAQWVDEFGASKTKLLTGLAAHVFQHEVDHLEGVLFVDRVEDSNSWMNRSEYEKRVVAKQRQQKPQPSNPGK